MRKAGPGHGGGENRKRRTRYCTCTPFSRREIVDDDGDGVVVFCSESLVFVIAVVYVVLAMMVTMMSPV